MVKVAVSVTPLFYFRGDGEIKIEAVEAAYLGKKMNQSDARASHEIERGTFTALAHKLLLQPLV